MPRVSRWLRWFEKDGDAFLGEVRLKGISLAALQELFDVPADDPMYDCFPVGPEHVAILQTKIAHAIDLERYAYFVEADSED